MRLFQYIYSNDSGWSSNLDSSFDSPDTVILIFSSPDISLVTKPLNDLTLAFPNSKFMGCSTSGEIVDNTLSIDRFVVQIIQFEKSRLRLVHIKVTDANSSKDIGKQLAQNLKDKDLKSIFILSDGLNVNGSQLTEGISSIDLKDVIITGGLAGDDYKFEKTWTIVDKKPQEGYVSALGIYGKELYIGYGSQSGWNTLGVRREVTLSADNILYELDNQPALKLYKHYLGKRAEGLPSTGLLFPLGIYHGTNEIKVRTILGVDEKRQSITFAGDIPQGSIVTLMKSNFNDLIKGATDAVKAIKLDSNIKPPLLSIAISCLGRRLVLGPRVEDEIEAVFDMLPKGTTQIGYYSYGEISLVNSGKCDLFNQTMTLTLIGEY
ncbi:MAG: hypothetical protein GXO60_07495 [Epsilonproteobacteria bacterium]|nr:hypothetical protein [Campylobacterota bacterium]